MFGENTVIMEPDIGPSPASFTNYSTSWTPVDGTTPVSTNPSRKRSRDETAFEIASADNPFPSAQDVNPPAPIPKEPVYGEGMVLLNPQSGRAIAAESQTGTWYEDKVAEEARAKQEAAERPRMPVGRKSMRLSQSSIRATFDTPNMSAPASPPKSTPTAEIDDATMALGIAWTKMASEDPDLQAAARGWARYLEVHYSRHIHRAEILLKNRTLDAYLVGCDEGFFLFTEDLLRGQLVGRTWDAALNNLRSQPIQFEGFEVLQAERTPGPEADVSAPAVINGWNDWDRINNQRGNNGQLVNGQAGASGMDID